MTYKLLIDGRLWEGNSTMEVLNPATGAAFAKCPVADEPQMNEAVAAAKKAFPAWSALGYTARKEALETLADKISKRSEEMAAVLTQEQGKPLGEARMEVGGAAAGLRAIAAMKLENRIVRESANELIIERRDALGIIAAIIPWNFPLHMLVMKIAPALITGNTVVLKPAPTTPLTALLVGEIAQKLFPPGVVNFITLPNHLATRLTAHPDVAKISFTGSTATGKQVMQSAAAGLKRLTLELGGNDAALVLDDADVTTVAPAIYASAMFNAGQICIATKRVYVPRKLYDAFCDAFARMAKAAVVGDGTQAGTTMGPVQNKAQYAKMLELLEIARADGEIIAGGNALGISGYFIPPTIVRNIEASSRLVREEQFGPVLPVLCYDSIDDAISQINEGEYGLGGSVWTSNAQLGLEVAGRLQSGTTWVNKVLDLPFDVPFRGAKQSGMGVENGLQGLEEYTQARIINAAL